MFPPSRIVCLTEETVETLYLLGEEHRIVGVSGYAVRPPQVRREKPRVSAFISADFAKIIELQPDLVLTFSDLQADIAAELIRKGVPAVSRPGTSPSIFALGNRCITSSRPEWRLPIAACPVFRSAARITRRVVSGAVRISCREA
jgi:ABC-type Fe3+-hydroxamate transport system substrate-binding protein